MGRPAGWMTGLTGRSPMKSSGRRRTVARSSASLEAGRDGKSRARRLRRLWVCHPRSGADGSAMVEECHRWI
ncbi:MAG: hypothetical protein JWL72_2417 [Ilumatobacteraceae bacterium]|nr:hypothetical protein [Ilumatobacteraceae bacterium]